MTRITKKIEEVDLVGVDGNIFSVMGTVKRWMSRNGFSVEDQAKMVDEMKSKTSYDQSLFVAMNWVDKINEKIRMTNYENGYEELEETEE
jgi:hypothetical protein